MPSTTETGHAKNVANFHNLIDFCTGYGTNYAPSRSDLKITNLKSLESDAQNALADVIAKRVLFNNAVNVRMDIFAGLKSLSTRLLNALEATDASDQLIKDAKTINKKIQGKRATKVETPTDSNTPVPITISTSQQSYDQLIQHFSALIELLQSEPSYAPNEAALKITTITSYRNDLLTKNNDVSSKYTDVSNSRINRDRILYAGHTGLVYIAQEVKKYVKSVFGASSQEYGQVTGIKFTLKKI